MKYSDDLNDVNNNLALSCVFGVLCAVSSAVAILYNSESAYIFIAILIGTFLALKVDSINHIVTLVIFVVILLIYGIPELNLTVLLVCTLGAFLDEFGHELISKITDNHFLNLFFEYRFVMKIVTFILAICGAFDILIFICFIIFELSYLMAGFLFERLN